MASTVTAASSATGKSLVPAERMAMVPDHHGDVFGNIPKKAKQIDKPVAVSLSKFSAIRIRISARFADALHGDVARIHVRAPAVCAANYGFDDHYHASTRAFHETNKGYFWALTVKNPNSHKKPPFYRKRWFTYFSAWVML